MLEMCLIQFRLLYWEVHLDKKLNKTKALVFLKETDIDAAFLGVQAHGGSY